MSRENDCEKLQLGQKVWAHGRMVRREDYRRPYIHKEWVSIPTAPRVCFIVGQRTLQKGYVENMGEDGRQWHQKGRTRVFLVADNMNRAPFYVLPEDLKTEAPQ